MELVFQVAKVNKPLLSVGDMRVVFDKGGSYLYNKKTDDIVRIKRERGVFVLEVFADRSPKTPVNNDPVFRRRD